MPNKLRNLSGKKIVKYLEKNGFSVCQTRGSHFKMRRIILTQKQTLTVPVHNFIPKGTLHDIYNQILEYMPESPELNNFFFTE
jgi:predicted RNA binding protein YcfA (HicA-like mRNA interferase family)